MSTLQAPYHAGTLTIGAAATSFIGTGVAWTDIEEGDLLIANGAIGVIDTINQTTFAAGTLILPWTGGALTAQPYLILRMSFLRYEPAILQDKIRQMIAKLTSAGVIYQVVTGNPDPGIGNDGDYAINISSGIWKLWLKVSGSWVFQGSPTGVTWTGPWTTGPYVAGQGVSRLGKSYIAKRATTNEPPESSPTAWDILLSNSVRTVFPIWAPFKPLPSEVLVSHIITAPVTFAANFLESRARVFGVSTSTAVFNVYKSGVLFGTITFSASNQIGTFSSAGGSFGVDDVLSILAPTSQDATLSDFMVSLVGYY